MQSKQTEKPPEMLNLKERRVSLSHLQKKKTLNVTSLNSVFSIFKFTSIFRQC